MNLSLFSSPLIGLFTQSRVKSFQRGCMVLTLCFFYVAIAKDVCYYTSILSPISKLYAQRLKGMRPQGVY